MLSLFMITGISTSLNVWNQISAVYHRFSGRLYFNHIDSMGNTKRQSLLVSRGMFVAGSKIALGQWIPGEGVVVSPSPGFRGKIDEVRIWNRLLSGTDVKSSWKFNVQQSAKNLAILWKLNEGEGTVITDVASRINLYIQPIDRAVQWVYSGAEITVLPVSTTQPFTNPVFRTKAMKWCSAYILQSPLETKCRGQSTGSQVLSPSQVIYYHACLEITAASGDVAAGVEIVVAFSDLCQVSLGLRTWPAQELCNYQAFVNSPQMNWFGSECKSACFFGTKIRQTNRCRCRPGFFGVDCARVCPGGIVSHCNNHGACAPETGHCSCRYNWQGPACNRCQSGYYGRDCSVNFGGGAAGGATSFVSLSGNGRFVDLDRAAWVYRGAAEFNAIVSARLSFGLQFRQVVYGTGVRLRCAIVRVAQSVLAIHSSIGTGVVATLNGKPIDVNQKTPVSSLVVFSKASHDKFEITGPEGLKMILYHRDIYFDVQVTMDKSLCQDSCGLFGNCGGAGNKTLNCSSGGLLEQYDKSKIRQEDIDAFMNRWTIPRNESRFKDVLKIAKETQTLTAAGTCLFFSQTAIVTPAFVNVFKGDYVTLQFYLKAKDLVVGGTILSFALNTNFALRINGSLKVHYGLSVFNTRIYAEHEKWNHISLVYHRKTGILEFFFRNAANILQTRILAIGLGAFEANGKLALGLWQATSGIITDPRSFSGWIDELVIWNKRFDSALINHFNKISVTKSVPGLAALWKFNEGTGLISKDLVGSLHLHIPAPPWRSPVWEPSDVNVAFEPSALAREAGVPGNQTTARCEKIFNSHSFNDSCGSMKARKDFFYQSCLEDIVSSGSIDASKESAMSFARECQVRKNLSSLPGQHLCGIFADKRFDDWTGTSCDTVCVFGVVNSNSCRCDRGYWGETCSNECPGGASNPCNGHGVCDAITGVCLCEKRWRGDIGCTSCTRGWIGRECAIAKPRQSNPTTVTSTIGTGGIIVGLDGSVFRLKSVGEFVLMKNSEMEVQARQIPCQEDSLCINAVALSTRSASISIHAPYSKGGDPVITVNGKSFEEDNPGETSLVGVTITAQAANEYLVKYGDKLSVRVMIEGQHLTLEGTPSKSFCSKLGGLLGSCRSISNSSDNTTLSLGNETMIPTLLHLLKAPNINRAVVETFGVSSRSRHIVVDTIGRHETVVVYGGGYSLFFSLTAIFSDVISNLFVGNVVTFEMMVKINCDATICGGPILSYTAEQSFYISTYSSLRVIIGAQTFDTGFRVEVKRWNQVTVTLWIWRLEMSVCLTFSKGTLLCKVFNVATNPFIHGGTLAIGTWQPSPDGVPGVIPTTTFTGEIDEFRTWDRAFDYAFLQQHWLANVRPGIENLTGLWKLNEGNGRLVKDLVGNNHLHFPDEPWNTPVWYYSDLPIPYKPITYPKGNNGINKQTANTTCANLFRRGPLKKSCNVLDPLTMQTYFDMCVRAVVDSGRNSRAIESVLLFSDYCMKTLGLDHWPARPLCNDFHGEVFPNWIGKNCDIRCIFGQRDCNNTEHCKCNTGYWGLECNETCPGGAKNPCNKHGTCDPITGRCVCDLTWQGNENCSTCSLGWTGGDCSVAISNVKISSGGVHLSGVFGLSHFVALDGSSYHLNVIGEYYLFYSVHVHFFIQIHLVICNGHFSCANSIAFRTTNHILILHAPYISAGHPVVWLDGAVVNLDSHAITTSSYGFLFRKQSGTLYIFDYSTLQLSIRVYGRYLSLTPKVSGSLCENSYGMLGSCNKHFLESFRPAFPLSNCTADNRTKRVEITPRTHAYGATNFTNEILRRLVQNLKVPACDSLFEYRYQHYQEYRQANAGYALHFDSTAVVSSEIIQPFKSNDVTIEFFLKTIKPGVILSYCKTKTFVLTNSAGYFSIYFGDREFPTNITVELNQWSQIALVFRKVTGTLQIYHFDYRGQLTRQDVFIGADPYPPGGILAIGAWQPSLDGSGRQLRGYFTGDIDDLRIWSMAYHPAVVFQSWQKRVEINTEHLVRLWKFDEGEGTSATEHITGSSLSLESAPWRSPVWRYSELNLKPPLKGASNSKTPFNRTFEEFAKTFCSDVILSGPLHFGCTSLGSGISTYYFKACLTVAVTSGDVYASLEVVIAYADYCQSVLALPIWPARLLCNKFPKKSFPVWIGPRCDGKCFNRKHDITGTCDCRRGYWGNQCQNVCPGGTLHPCHNHGICDVITGTCSCLDNWKGSTDCGTCTRNWRGKDCVLAIRDLVPIQINIIAVASSTARYVTFDGMAFSLATVGDFYLLRTRIHVRDDFILQVRCAPCHSQSVCIVAVALKFSTTLVVFHAPIVNQGAPLVWINQVKVNLNATNVLREANSTIAVTLDSPSRYTIRYAGVFSLGVRVVDTALSLAVDMDRSYCNGSANGILGSCDGDPGNDLPLKGFANLDNVTQKVLNQRLMKTLEVRGRKNLFSILNKLYTKTSLESGARYALSFYGSGASSVPLFHTFPINTDITIELLFKPLASGTVLSYAYNQTFAITLNHTIRVEFGQVFDSGVRAHLGSWYHLSITWHYDIKLLQLYIITKPGNIQRRQFKIPGNPFKPGGILTLGYWQPSAGDTEECMRYNFVGILDELRVWHRSFNPVTVQQNWRMNVNPTAPSLSGLWKFNEGSGLTVHNTVNNEHIHLPSEVWSPPVWIISDADIALNLSNVEKPFEIYFSNETFRAESESWCRSLFYRGPLNKHCKKLGALLEFYYLSCVQTVVTKKQIFSILSVVVEFSDYCQKSLSLTKWPAQALCNKFGDAKFPYWIGRKCDVPCVFGHRDPRDHNKCVCIQGYWGEDCSKLCPGGYRNPCFGHGVCSQSSGKCECDINWRGDVTCRRCSVDWFGEQCQYAAVRIFPLETFSIASIKGQGYFTTFLGISFHLPTYGEFYLIRSISSNFYVQIRQTQCMHRSSYRLLCATAFAFRFNVGLTVTIRAAVTSNNAYYPLVWTNGKAIRVDHVTHLSAAVRMTRIAFNRYEITGPGGLLFVLAVGQSLSVRLRVPTSLCIDSTGILGACAQRLSYQNATDILALKSSIKRGRVSVSDSLFVYKSEFFQENRNPTGAWFNLRIINSHVVSDTLLLGNHETVTIELFLKLKNYGGTILSYGRQNFLTLTSEKEIRLVYASVEFKTGLQLSLNVWTQITLVWLKATKVLQLYYHDFTEVFHLRTYRFHTPVFDNQGRLYIGKWCAGSGTIANSPKSDFQGEVDEIRIWNRLSVPDLVRRNWGINAHSTLPGLLHLWKFDNVEGTTAVDSVSGKFLHLPIFNKPSWDFSDLTIPRNNPLDSPTFQNATFQSLAQQFCHSVILSGPLNNKCQTLGPAVSGFYYKICLSDVTSTNDLSMAIAAVISFADFCEDAMNLTFWPARELCNHFPTQYFPSWIGQRCNVPCIFGTPQVLNGSTICVCVDGYWGPACANLCPGGLWNVCGNHGKCDRTNGTCECDARWKGSPKNGTSMDVTSSPVSCSVCTDGWRSKDCSIGIENPYANSTFLSETAICVAFGDPHVTNFGRASYHLGITGAFEALRTTSSALQILQVPCENSVSCRRIRELGLRSRSSNISLRSDGTGRIATNVTSQLTIENIETLKYSTSWQEIGPTSYRWLDQHRLEVVNEESVKLTILAYFDTLGVAIEIPRSLNTSSRALCGSVNEERGRDGNDTPNLTDVNETAAWILIDAFNQTTRDAYIDKEIRISTAAKTMMLSQQATGYKTGGGYMLSLYTNYLSLAQDFNYPVLSEVTVEIWVTFSTYEKESRLGSGKTLRGRRVLLSIVQERTALTVIYYNQVIISWGPHTVDTGLVLNESVWTHLSLSWRTNDGKLVVLLSTHGGSTRLSVHHGVMVNQHFYIHRGFYLGHDGNGDLSNVKLALGIDELRVWQFARKEKDILKTMTLKYKKYVEGLVLFCGFDEGLGDATNATVYALDQQATASGYYHRGNKTEDLQVAYELKPSSTGPTWQPSGAPYPNIGNYDISFESEESENSAKDACFQLFYTGNLYKYCGRKMPTQTLFYYEACLMDVKNSENMEHAKLSVSLYAFYCQKVLAVPACRLHGYYEGFEACEGEPRFTVIVIVCISSGVVLFLFLIIVIVILICKRRRKKKKKGLGPIEMRKYEQRADMYGDEEYSEDDMDGQGTSGKQENISSMYGQLQEDVKDVGEETGEADSFL